MRVLAPQTSGGHKPEVSLSVPAGSHSHSDACLLARSRRDTVRTIERVEVTVDNLLSSTKTPSQLENKPLHLSPLAHLGFENPLEESDINHPDLIYHLIRRDEMPIARVSLPSPHTPKFRFKSGFNPSACIQPRLLRKLVADQSKAPATSFPPNTPSASTICSGAIVSPRCVPSSHSCAFPPPWPLTALSLSIHSLLPKLRCTV